MSVDEKSQLPALNRTQKSLPMFPGRLSTMTHDDDCNGTTRLFALMNVADGSVDKVASALQALIHPLLDDTLHENPGTVPS